ncbi:hypothetical protein BBF96_12675 [Anoxybacter fermentans]|uniref:Uncharacterized protein n=1 Tax=Anoxybacter fermentans TaxID=1323375 RepID=A0A3Q9HRU4_9FIRM|nr:hypothetical protein [Anoxybacter fermentans]AZR74174.1 hypothetical protein BBF96_12675 [Anoxybacter fermentans]
MGNYYLLLRNGTMETIKNFLNVYQENDKLVVETTNDSITFEKNQVVMHGTEDYWVKVLELFKCIDRIMYKRINSSLAKAVTLGYLFGKIS